LFGAFSFLAALVLIKILRENSPVYSAGNNCGKTTSCVKKSEDVPGLFPKSQSGRDQAEANVYQSSSKKPVAATPTNLLSWTITFLVSLCGQMIYSLAGRLIADRATGEIITRIGASSVTGILLSSRTAGILLLGPVSGSVSDRIGRCSTIVLASTVQLLCYLVIAVFKAGYILFIFIPVSLFATVINRVVVTALAGDRAEGNKSAVYMSRFSTFLDMGNAFASIAAFPVYSTLGFGWVAVIAGGLLVVNIMSTIAGRRKFYLN
ncbi:MAG: hypothetical protein ACOC7U_01885, partial [Spirochaetota bacterium]